MDDINLSLIQTFYHLGRTGSYSGAGQALNLSHPAVANQVRRLEQMLGERLVEAERGARKLRFTSRGTQLFALIKPDFDIMFSRLSVLLQKQRPMVRMGMSQGAFHHLMSRVLARFRALHPEVGIVAYERDTALADLVRQGSLDVFLAERHFGDPLVEQQLLGYYRLCLVRPVGWLEGPEPGGLHEWSVAHPFISFEPGQILRDIATDYLGRGVGRVQPIVATSSSACVKRCVADGLGFTVLPEWCIEPEDHHILAVTPLPDLAPVPIYFGTARILRGTLLLDNLFQLCRSELVGTRLDDSIGAGPPTVDIATGENSI